MSTITMKRQLANVNYIKGTAKRVANNTVKYNRWHDGATVYRLHHTDIVVIHNNTYTLNSGGWQTLTTKDRINAYAPVRLYQKNHEWFLAGRDVNGGVDWDHPIPFYDGMKVDSSGVVIEPPRKDFYVTFDGKWERTNDDSHKV